jgi:hypothetical protein
MHQSELEEDPTSTRTTDIPGRALTKRFLRHEIDQQLRAFEISDLF